MRILPIDLNNKRQVDDFIRLPFSIYRSIPQWAPPLQTDERLRLNRTRFQYYKHSRASFFIAYEGTRAKDIFKSVRGSGQFKHAEVVQIGVKNEAMQKDMENFGIDFYKTHRTFVRPLDN